MIQHKRIKTEQNTQTKDSRNMLEQCIPHKFMGYHTVMSQEPNIPSYPHSDQSYCLHSSLKPSG
jgi:hypothetical protein